MADASTIKSWAKGPSAEDAEVGEEEEGGAEVEVPLWAGLDERSSEELLAMEAEELESIAAWFGEAEPEIWAAMHEAIAAGADEDGIEAALAALEAAEQYLVPEYLPFTSTERAAAVEVAMSLAADGVPGDRAIVIGLAEARRGDLELDEEEVELDEEELEDSDEEDEELEDEEGEET